MPYTAFELAQLLQGQVVGDGSVVITGFAPASTARPGELTFAENEKFFARADQSAASAVLVDGDYTSEKKTLVRVNNARIGFAKVLPLFFPEPKFASGIHPTTIISPGAVVDPSAHIGPHCVIGDEVKIGARSVLHSGIQMGTGSSLGDDCQVFPNVVLYSRTQVGSRVRLHAGSVIGSDGFGYVLDGNFHRKVPQAGNVIIHDDVEIGANVTIDRGALGPTVIGRGTKIDNLVQIAHNVTIGDHCLVVAQTGIAGSTKLGSYVTLAGQVGLAGHLKIGNKAIVAAQSGVMHDIPDGEKWFGSPAQKDRRMKRQLIAMEQLPDLLKQVGDLQRQIDFLKRQLQPMPEDKL